MQYTDITEYNSCNKDLFKAVYTHQFPWTKEPLWRKYHQCFMFMHTSHNIVTTKLESKPVKKFSLTTGFYQNCTFIPNLFKEIHY